MASSVEVFNEFEYDRIHNCFIGFITDIAEKENGRRILAYCPFCGTRLPDFSYEYPESLEQELGRHYSKIHPKDIPLEFQTDEWWKKRGIKNGYLETIYDPIRFEENIEVVNGERVLKIY
jgi:hypothetical protein